MMKGILQVKLFKTLNTKIYTSKYLKCYLIIAYFIFLNTNTQIYTNKYCT